MKTYEIIASATNGLSSAVVASDTDEERDRVTVETDEREGIDGNTSNTTGVGGSVTWNSLNLVA